MGEPLRILIVDDSPRIRRTVRAVVADLATAFEECSDGDEVLARYEAFGPHWVLMDLAMKRVDGIRATVLLTERHPGARVVIVSDFDQDDLRRAAREAGAVGYVAKSDLLPLRKLLMERGEESV